MLRPEGWGLWNMHLRLFTFHLLHFTSCFSSFVLEPNLTTVVNLINDHCMTTAFREYLYMVWSELDVACNPIPLVDIRELILNKFLLEVVQLLWGKYSSPSCFLHLNIVSGSRVSPWHNHSSSLLRQCQVTNFNFRILHHAVEGQIISLSALN